MRYWKRLNPDGSTGAVENYWHDQDVPGAVEITQAEFDAYIASLPPPPPPPDWKALYQAAKNSGNISEEIKIIARRLDLT